MQELARLAWVKRIQLTVVFDGAPDPQFPDGSSCRGVKIFYSRPGSDADARIIDLVESERNKKNLVVVTSDGKLASRIRVTGVRVIRSGEFRRMLDEVVNAAPGDDTDRAGGTGWTNTPSGTPSGRQPSGTNEGELSEWMRYFGLDHSDDD